MTVSIATNFFIILYYISKVKCTDIDPYTYLYVEGDVGVSVISQLQMSYGMDLRDIFIPLTFFLRNFTISSSLLRDIVRVICGRVKESG